MNRIIVELSMAKGQTKKLIFAIGLLCISVISLSQSIEFQNVVSEIKDGMYADGWKFIEDGYIDINDDWSIATEDYHFSAYTKYMAIVIVENCPLYSPYIEMRDADGYDHEIVNEKGDDGNYRLAMASHYSSVGFSGSFVGKISSPEMVNAYILLIMNDD